jgi:hypothetical protein
VVVNLSQVSSGYVRLGQVNPGNFCLIPVILI